MGPLEPGSVPKRATRPRGLRRLGLLGRERECLGLMPFAAIAFLWFIGAIQDLLGDYEDRFFSTVFFGSGLLFLAIVFVFVVSCRGHPRKWLNIGRPRAPKRRSSTSGDSVVTLQGSNIYALRWRRFS